MFSSINIIFYFINSTFAFNYQLFDLSNLDSNLSSNNVLLITSALILLTIPLYNYQNNNSFFAVGNLNNKFKNLVDGMSQRYQYFRDTSSNNRFVTRRNNQEYKFAMNNGGFVGGISNDGNTCFMNSVLQSLASSKELMKFLDGLVEGENRTGSNFVFTRNLDKFLNGLNGRYGDTSREFSTRYLLRNMKNGPKQNLFSSYNQEDAQEFYQNVLSLIEGELKLQKEKPEVTDEESGEQSDEESVVEKSTESLDPNSEEEPKYIDPTDDIIFGLDKLGSIGKVYVPAKQVDPNIPTEDENKVFGLNLITPVDGISVERIGCLTCGEIGGIRYSVVSGLGLNLPSTNDYYYELSDLLNEWIAPEIIEDVECNRCGLNQTKQFIDDKINSYNLTEKLLKSFEKRLDDINFQLSKNHIEDDVYKKLSTKEMIKKSKKSKQIYLSRPPPLLSIHINRSVFDTRTYMVKKNPADVKFPSTLDLSPWVAEPKDINTDARLPFRKQDENLKPLVEESFEDDNEDYGNIKQSMDNDDKKSIESLEVSPQPTGRSSTSGSVTPITSNEDRLDSKLEDMKINPTIEKSALSYNLIAVISHFGTHNYGHYISFRKFRGTWFRISDETVNIVSEDLVLNSQGTFMLFYEFDNGEVEELIPVQSESEEESEHELERETVNNKQIFDDTTDSDDDDDDDDDEYDRNSAVEIHDEEESALQSAEEHRAFHM